MVALMCPPPDRYPARETKAPPKKEPRGGARERIIWRSDGAKDRHFPLVHSRRYRVSRTSKKTGEPSVHNTGSLAATICLQFGAIRNTARARRRLRDPSIGCSGSPSTTMFCRLTDGHGQEGHVYSPNGQRDSRRADSQSVRSRFGSIRAESMANRREVVVRRRRSSARSRA